MAFSLVWSLGYLISIIVFSTVIGLIFYFNETSKKDLAKYLFVSVICTFAMIYVMGLFKDQLYSAIGIYNYALLFLIAFILILIGYLLSKEKTFKGSFKKVLSLSYLSFLLVALVCVLSRSDLFGLNSLQVTLVTTILFNLLIEAVFFTLKKFNLTAESFKMLRDLYFIFGIYFLIVSLFLPNIISLNMEDMKPINIVSIESMIFTFVFIVVVTVLGLWYYRKNTLLK
ncbi:DUF2162 family putative transporter [uncultured Methanobrevibacter sp.]|uniref:DUF2162 family putative transporter n=1 Tax=uncultured Methanobrevibacter sp. TaxID=253161 RepID=UPI0025D6D2CF|nr:DUF2162 family putative transporter [uncultured Methanobrevibacter sp.]